MQGKLGVYIVDKKKPATWPASNIESPLRLGALLTLYLDFQANDASTRLADFELARWACKANDESLSRQVG
jgi:hypothetical protein